jgi:hypothetical protein
MLFDMQNNIQITGRTAEGAGFAQAAEPDSSSIFHAGGNFGVDSFLTQYSAFALAFLTGIGDDAACSLACGTSTRNAEESLLISDLAAPGTGAAGHRRFAWGCTRAFAFFASLVPANCDFRLGAEEGLFKFQIDILAQIGAALGAGSTTRTSSAENVSESKEVAEDVTEILEDGGVKTNASSAAYASVTEAIVQRTLFAVRENRVGLTGFFEFLFRVRIIRIAIGMKL